MLVLFNKPYQVLCQFTGEPGKKTLADYIPLPGIYAAGRLDQDSEGLLLLTDEGALQNRISHPDFKLPKTYWVQVEGQPNEDSLNLLRSGVEIQGKMTRPTKTDIMSEPRVWPRTPPIRYRKNIPTSWISITLTEGRNRQVRRMTAAVGHPTLRLIRYAIGPWDLGELQPGEWKESNDYAIRKLGEFREKRSRD